MKNVIGNTSLALVRTGMIGVIVKLTLLWGPVVPATRIAAYIGQTLLA